MKSLLAVAVGVLDGGRYYRNIGSGTCGSCNRICVVWGEGLARQATRRITDEYAKKLCMVCTSNFIDTKCKQLLLSPECVRGVV